MDRNGKRSDGGNHVNEPLLLKTSEAARRLGISRSFLYEQMAMGEIESVRIGYARRIPTAALDNYVARLRSTASRDNAV
jgi:excisionase family DNA binding protein